MIAIPNMSKPKDCDECLCENDSNCQALDILKGECRENSTFSILTWDACPIIDIVTCGECKHWYNDADCGMACEFTNMKQPSDGFCNWGERK